MNVIRYKIAERVELSMLPYQNKNLSIEERANDLLCDEMTNVLKKRMGSTAAMLCFAKGRYYICNVGDSPVFMLRNSRFTEISHEHTEKENYIKMLGAEIERF